MKTIHIKTAQELAEFGQQYTKENIEPGDKILVKGTMGAGKTTLAQGIANGLGLEVNITSPTFSKLNIYNGSTDFYHFDLYNLEDPEELENLGIYDFTESENGVSYIEWWDKFPGFFSSPYHLIEILITDTGRQINTEFISC
ncbi:MAG: tRNA (adenosine(37)-N6)-threonylcarbamoyltransferase complex ATPase subunit type 1 TsaE [Candidatus Cloacimonetes bacterium]|nr:tRNA (adenosine(37)-N6)-threonylcarbamoyltransferase complex ATPase subunit type 1 TsaE [Candidatus Cloacimonadota bacterium]